MIIHIFKVLKMPEWIIRVLVQTFYFVIWPLFIFSIFIYLFNIYISIVITSWLTYWIVRSSKIEKEYIDVSQITISLASKIPRGKNKWQRL